MIRYVYKNNKYLLLNTLKRDVWEKDHILLGNASTQEEFDALGVSIKVEEYDPLESVDLDTLRKNILEELEAQFDDYSVSKYTYLNSSLGFKINANDTAFRNVSGLLTRTSPETAELLDNSVQSEGESKSTTEKTEIFMDFDNVPHQLRYKDFLIMLNEISDNGSRAYNVKWNYKTRIEQAKTKQALVNMYNAGFKFGVDD